MMGGMAMRTWVDILAGIYAKAATANPGSRTNSLRKGISRGVEMADVSLVTKEFAVRIQIISLLKSGTSCCAFELGETSLTAQRTLVDAKLYGVGSEEARRSDTLWNSRFI